MQNEFDSLDEWDEEEPYYDWDDPDWREDWDDEEVVAPEIIFNGQDARCPSAAGM